jgi:hypothetical protein
MAVNMTKQLSQTSRRVRWLPWSTVCLAACLAADCRSHKPDLKQEPSTNRQTTPSAVPSAPERPPMFANRPLVNVKVDLESCFYQLYVNGGLVTASLEGNPAHEEHPVNHWLRSGSNELQLYLYKPEGEEDQCDAKVALTVKDNDNEQAPAVTAFTLGHSAKGAAAGAPVQGSSAPGLFDSHALFRASDKGDVRVLPAKVARLSGLGAEILVVSRTFETSLPFPEWAFFRGDKLPQWFEFPTDEKRRPSYDLILQAYQQVWSLLDKRDVNGFLTACEERSREMDTAFYKSPGETRAQLRKDLEAAVSDADFKLVPLDGKGFWKYTVGSTGKLIMLTQGSRGSPILRFQMKDGTPFSLIFPLAFRKEGERFVVTR